MNFVRATAASGDEVFPELPLITPLRSPATFLNMVVPICAAAPFAKSIAI